ncbi:MAG: AI-2E family transporter [Gammaproteobacteria bacterium]|nr:AI-2E family transporter [Gammaproteobacteria bacterium]
MEFLKNWFREQFSNPQVVILSMLLVVLTATVYFFGNMLAPVIAAVVLAYLLQGIVHRLENAGLPHLAAVTLVFLTFMTVLLILAFGLLPLLFRQMSQLFQQVPRMVSEAQKLLLQLPSQYPAFVNEVQIRDFMGTLGSELIGFGQRALSYSVTSLVTLITIIVYLILVPLMVFFMVRDKEKIVVWLTSFLPSQRQLANDVWAEVNDQIGNYVRGKVYEIIIVGVVAYSVYRILGLQYAVLLSVITGLSVLIPYVGAAVVTIPVALVAYSQWGVSASFYYVLIAYGIIQALDGNLLAPLLFSEAVNLHPVAIIVAILFFGGLWGFWGVFFAIPLATVINAVVRAWPRAGDIESASQAAGD